MPAATAFTQQVERWQAQRVIVALPIFVAARGVQDAPDFLRHAAASTVYAPWLVANMHLKAPLIDRPGPALSWGNVIYGTQGLGYVDAMHQSLQPVPGPTVLTHYRALGDVAGSGVAGGKAADVSAAGRKLLMERSWSVWRDLILAELAVAHPDLATKVTRVDITRHGCAVAVAVAVAVASCQLPVASCQLPVASCQKFKPAILNQGVIPLKCRSVYFRALLNAGGSQNAGMP